LKNVISENTSFKLIGSCFIKSGGIKANEAGTKEVKAMR
jgi:hypothetical protein